MDDRAKAVHTARHWLRGTPVFLDTETTGLGDTAEVCDLAGGGDRALQGDAGGKVGGWSGTRPVQLFGLMSFLG